MRISDSLEIGCDFWTLHPACYNALVVQVARVERTGNGELANPYVMKPRLPVEKGFTGLKRLGCCPSNESESYGMGLAKGQATAASIEEPETRNQASAKSRL